MRREAAAHFQEDAALAALVEAHGPLGLDPADDPFRRLIVSLIRQQVSTDAADAIETRLFAAVEVTPGALLATDEDILREAGLSAQKTEYVHAVAAAWQEQGYDHDHFERMSDDAVRAELTDIHGVGPWTAKMFLMFGLGRPDVFPVEDLGVRRGMELVCAGEMTRGEMRERATEWAPYRSYASLYLWRAYEG